MTSKPKLPVIFKVGGGEVAAYFPTLPGTNDPFTCTCYVHVGQRGAASIAYAQVQRPGKPNEYAPLLAELRQIYDDCELVIKRRFHYGYAKARIEALKGAA